MSAQPDQPLGHDLELRVGRVEWPRTHGQVHREWDEVQARMRRIALVPGRRMDLTSVTRYGFHGAGHRGIHTE